MSKKKNSTKKDSGSKIEKGIQSEQLNESKLPDFEFTPPPPKKNDNSKGDNKKEE